MDDFQFCEFQNIYFPASLPFFDNYSIFSYLFYAAITFPVFSGSILILFLYHFYHILPYLNVVVFHQLMYTT